jgi:hypothetical protein
VAATTEAAPSRSASRSSCFGKLDEQGLGRLAQRDVYRQAGERGDVGVLTHRVGQLRGQHQRAGHRTLDRAGAGAAEQPALAERRAQRAGHGEVGLVLDALGEHHRAGALGVRVDRVHDLGDRGAGAFLYQPQVQLDHVGAQQRHERQGHRLGADVVHRDAPADRADPLDRAQQLGRAGGQCPLGDLQDHPQPARGGLRDGEQVLQGRAVEHLRLDVDEQGQRCLQAGGQRAGERRVAAGGVQLGEPAGLAGSGEELIRALERALRPAGQGLVGDHAAGVELDDGLEDAAHRPVPQDVVDGRRGSGRGDGHVHPSDAGTPR